MSRRLVAGSAVLAVGLSLLGAAPSAVADPAGDAAGGKAASQWIAGQLNADGLVPGPFGPNPDIGMSMDAVFALHASGDGALATPILDALDQGKKATDFFTYGEWGDPADRVSGATAKTLVTALVGGRNPRDFAGYDMVAETLSTVVTQADVAPGGRFADGTKGVNAAEVGRITDFGPSITYNSANMFGQTLAVIGLAGSGQLTRPVVDALLNQQCASGHFAIFYSRTATDLQTCDEAGGTPDGDTTGFALSALVAARKAGITGLDAAITRTVTFLVASQDATTGGWGGGGPTAAPNANSTGLVVQALAEADPSTPATAAAVADGAAYLRAIQVSAAEAGTPLAGELGAIAYNADEFAYGRTNGIDDVDTDTWLRATTQAALGLSRVGFSTLAGARAPVAPTLPAARLTVAAPKTFVLRGRVVTVRASGLAGGEQYAVTVAGRRVATGKATAAGAVRRSVRIPAAVAQGNRPVVVTGSKANRTGRATLKVLVPRTLPVRVSRKRARVGQVQRITVRRLAAGERVRVSVRNRTVRGVANRRGVAVLRVKATRPVGTVRVRVVGAFASRKGVVTFRVRR